MEEVTGDVEQTIKRQYALHFIPTLPKHSVLLHKRHKQYSYIYCVAKFLWIINQLISAEIVAAQSQRTRFLRIPKHRMTFHVY
jgi:hypothetical protein